MADAVMVGATASVGVEDLADHPVAALEAAVAALPVAVLVAEAVALPEAEASADVVVLAAIRATVVETVADVPILADGVVDLAADLIPAAS